MGQSYNNNNNNLNENHKITTQSIIRTIIDDDMNNLNNENDIDNDKNSLLNSNKDSCSNSSVSSASITDLSNILVTCKVDEEQEKSNLNDQHQQQQDIQQTNEPQENEKIECEHYNYAKLFFLLGLMFYFPLIYSIMYIREPNKNVKAFARVALVTLFLYPSFLILITLTTDNFSNGKIWEPISRQWLLKN